MVGQPGFLHPTHFGVRCARGSRASVKRGA
jgi:hypothetical protein